MKIQILVDERYFKLNESSILYNELKELVECEIVTELNYKGAHYFLVFDNFDLDHFDKKLLAKTILLHIPSPSIQERLSKYKVAGVVESRIYFNNFSLIFGHKKVIDFDIFEAGLINYAQDLDYISIIKKDKTEDYKLANMIVDYLKMHQDYFNNNLLE